jgi:hypothetical protein
MIIDADDLQREHASAEQPPEPSSFTPRLDCICQGVELIGGVRCFVYSPACPQHGCNSLYVPSVGVASDEVRVVKSWNGKDVER